MGNCSGLKAILIINSHPCNAISNYNYDCVSHFIRICVRFDVTLPLLRRTMVTFLEVGEKMVEFKYEYPPHYYFTCGRLGHPTQVCIKQYEAAY